jgi:hypothetical protein
MTAQQIVLVPQVLRDAAPLDVVAFALGSVRFHHCAAPTLHWGAVRLTPLLGPEDGCGECVVLGLELPAGVSLPTHCCWESDAAIHVLAGRLVCAQGELETVVAAGQVLELACSLPFALQAVAGPVRFLVRLAPASVPGFLAAMSCAPDLALAS